MKLARMSVGVAAMLGSTMASASAPLTLYPVQVGHETARYYRGDATLNLEMPTGAVEIRLLPVQDGQVRLAVAVFNKSGQAANFGIENIQAQVNGMPVALPNRDQLADAAERRARQQKVGTAIFAGVLAGVASTASNHHGYQQRVVTRRGVYSRTVSWHDNTPGIVGATAAVVGGAAVIHGINSKLDYTLDRIDGEILETTTVDPGHSFGGVVIVPRQGEGRAPSDIRLQVNWNGSVYPFSVRLTRSGENVPPPFPATSRDTADARMPAQQP
ncbi:hypothetical protein [Rhizorhabdus wittichii]